jgi:hypothetical protein
VTIEDFLAKLAAPKEKREHRLEKLAEQCVETGMPEELVPVCVEALQAGKSLPDVMAELEAMVGQGVA